ncbi:uncharacterized protein LOC129613400 [Condylostylus longicornis]|uniref:uncharacterized protein LOC129613400 n=1 Tax=Condylostylus longicornis TaxID=2530218 RepID=UPI00244DA5C1|nr:uncharacterized protein LOC129613400 [Condylostylus longicornis]
MTMNTNKNKSKKRKVKTTQNENGKKAKRVKVLENSNEGIENHALEENQAESTMEIDNEHVPAIIEDTEEEIKFPKDFNITTFREKLRGTNFISELRHFLHLAKKNENFISKYMSKKGKPLELVEALERIDKTHLHHVSYICDAFQMVLMKILADKKEYTLSAINASRYFLKSHSQIIEKLLKSPSQYHRTIILKLLTAIVCLEPELGRQILSCLEFLLNTKVIEKLLSHSTLKQNENESVRKSFIHFILSYLIDGNIVLIRNIMDKRHLFKALLSGLINDDSVTICVVLNTIKKFVLENPDVLKTKKVYLFDSQSLNDLAHLYNWPKDNIGKANKKIIEDNENLAKDENIEKNNEKINGDKLQVREAVHEFLSVLLTSRKYGLAFDSMTNYKQKKNQLQKKFLKSLKYPWMDDMKTELVINILKTCPDIARSIIRFYGPYVNPYKTAKAFWLNVVDFIRKLILACAPSIFHKILDKISLNDYTFLIKDICLSPEILVHLKGDMFLFSDNFELRFETSKLLLTMFQQFCNYMFAILDREKYKGSDMKRFKLDLINFISVNFPTMENILQSSFQTTRTLDFDNPRQMEYLDVILDLVLLVATHHRTFFNKSGLIIDYMTFLDPIFNSDELGTKNIKLELKAIKTILLLTPLKLSPDQKIFERILKCFVNVFVNGEKEMQKEAGNVLRSIFINTKFFSETNKLEIDIWLQALKLCDPADVDLLIFMFYACFQVPLKEVEEEINDNISNVEHSKFEKVSDLKMLFEKIESGEAVEGYVEPLSLSVLLHFIYLKIDQDEEIIKFLDMVSLLLFHYHPFPESIYEVYSNNSQNEANKYYMKKILKKNKVEAIPGTGEIPFYNRIQEAILKGDLVFFELFQDTTGKGKINILNGTKEHILIDIIENERLILLYIYLTIFTTLHLVEGERFKENNAKASHQFLKYFLKILHLLDSDKGTSFKGVIFGDGDLFPKTDIFYLKEILKYIYSSHIHLIQDFDVFAETESKQNFLLLLCDLTNSVTELIGDEVNEFLINFQQKIVHEIGVQVKKTMKNKTKPKSELITNVIESFRMTNDQCVEILKCICHLSHEDFVDKTEIQNKSVYFEILCTTLNRISALREGMYDKNLCIKLSNIYIELLNENNDFEKNLEKFEESFYNLLVISHQCIDIFPDRLFKLFFDCKKLTKSAIKLAVLMLERNPKLQSIFLDNIEKNLFKKEIIYPLLKILIHQNPSFKINNKLLKEIYQEFKNGFMKTIEKPQKSGVIYKENVEVSIYLVNEVMPINECVDFSKKIVKTDTVEIYQIKLLNAIFGKAIQSLHCNSDEYKSIFANFLNNCLQLYNIIFRRDSFDEKKIDYLNYSIYNGMESYFRKYNNNELIDFNMIKESQYWPAFYKNCLKYGIQKANDLLEDKINSSILKILAYLSSFIFSKVECENDETKQIFDMILSHSKFTDIVFDNTQSETKTQIFNLLLILVQKNVKILNKKHIPIFLGSYNAKLCKSDRYILALIQYYEKNEVNLYEFRPFVWGETAVSHYSLGKVDATTLEQQELTVDQVMSLIDRFTSEFTIENFPVWRKLNTLKQLPAVVFDNPENLVSNFGSNAVEKEIENFLFAGYNNKNDSKIDNSLLKLCLKRDILYENCYDPAFMIPLMCMCFAPEIQSQPVRPVQNGLLSILFAALSSHDKEMRLAAGCCQLRYRQHIESKKFFDQPLWIQAYDNIQNGLNQLQINWIKHKKNGIPKVPYISGLFLARAVNLLITPTDSLYKTIVMYLRLKETFDFLCVPEFNVLFHNSEVNHTLFQKFILQVIKDGIKSSSDLVILITNNIFKALMGFYFSVMTNLDLNLQILSIISICCKIPASSKILIDYIGILPWLNSVIEEIEYYKFDTIEAVISIINNLWFSIKIREAEFYNFQHLETVIFKLLIKLSSHITSRISLNNFARYLNILQKSAGKNHKSLTEENLNRLLLCAQKHYKKDIWRILNIKKYGPVGVESKECFLRRLKDDNSYDDYGQLALLSLREFIINWSQDQN